jgi:hypothetical protein
MCTLLLPPGVNPVAVKYIIYIYIWLIQQNVNLPTYRRVYPWSGPELSITSNTDLESNSLLVSSVYVTTSIYSMYTTTCYLLIFYTHLYDSTLTLNLIKKNCMTLTVDCFRHMIVIAFLLIPPWRWPATSVTETFRWSLSSKITFLLLILSVSIPLCLYQCIGFIYYRQHNKQLVIMVLQRHVSTYTSHRQATFRTFRF